MTWTEDMRAGALLAAAIADDGRLERALPGLCPGPRGALREDARRLAESDDRRRALSALAGRVRRAPSSDAALNARAASLLAVHVDRATGRRWLAAAPAARRSFRANDGLVDALRRATLSARRMPVDVEEDKDEEARAPHPVEGPQD